VCGEHDVCVHVAPELEANQVISPTVTLSISDRESLAERNEFEGDGLIAAVQR
jgi:hypothetical protein